MSAVRASSTPETARLLEVRDLAVSFETADGVVQAVRGISFGVERGRHARHRRRVRLGQERVRADNPRAHARARDLRQRPLRRPRAARHAGDELRAVRGAGIAMIFQDPLSSLHPHYRVGWQIAEMIRVHEKSGRRAARAGDRAARPRRDPAARAAGRRLSASVLGRHAAAGDDRDGVVAADPRLLIADEPTTALDVTVQAQILDLLRRMRDESGRRSCSSPTTWASSPIADRVA